MRTVSWHGLPLLAALIVCALPSAAFAQSFDAFLAALRADAASQGISQATFNAAFAGVTPDPRVVAAMRAEGIALAEGFAAAHVGRSPRRF